MNRRFSPAKKGKGLASPMEPPRAARVKIPDFDKSELIHNHELKLLEKYCTGCKCLNHDIKDCPEASEKRETLLFKRSEKSIDTYQSRKQYVGPYTKEANHKEVSLNLSSHRHVRQQKPEDRRDTRVPYSRDKVKERQHYQHGSYQSKEYNCRFSHIPGNPRSQASTYSRVSRQSEPRGNTTMTKPIWKEKTRRTLPEALRSSKLYKLLLEKYEKSWYNTPIALIPLKVQPVKKDFGLLRNKEKWKKQQLTLL
ncbi:unnamed protein product [Arabis nemorensis]|uniref:Zinc knuckle CX2CX4HX4C domain-containing protein n=1 Tax=Arabis nemorensis TaxID=586526 RepID=A0A565BK01_9BRAS|nr:unnamed protein product [Arabis nemorensis]